MKGLAEHLECFFESAAEGDLVQINKMLTNPLHPMKEVINLTDIDGFSALMIAAAEGHVAVVETLLKHGADPRLQTLELKSVAMHFAAKYGNVDILHKLASAKNTAPEVNVQNVNGDTPLLWACIEGKKAAVEVLVTKLGADSLMTNAYGATSLMCAMMIGERKVEDEPELPSETDDDRAAISQLLITKHPELVNKQDRDGTTAMHLAASCGYLNCVKVLMNAGADITLRNAIGETPLEEAAKTGVEGSEVCVAFLQVHWKRLEEEAAARMYSMLDMEDEKERKARKKKKKKKKARAKCVEKELKELEAIEKKILVEEESVVTKDDDDDTTEAKSNEIKAEDYSTEPESEVNNDDGSWTKIIKGKKHVKSKDLTNNTALGDKGRIESPRKSSDLPVVEEQLAASTLDDDAVVDQVESILSLEEKKREPRLRSCLGTTPRKASSTDTAGFFSPLTSNSLWHNYVQPSSPTTALASSAYDHSSGLSLFPISSSFESSSKSSSRRRTTRPPPGMEAIRKKTLEELLACGICQKQVRDNRECPNQNCHTLFCKECCIATSAVPIVSPPSSLCCPECQVPLGQYELLKHNAFAEYQRGSSEAQSSSTGGQKRSLLPLSAETEFKHAFPVAAELGLGPLHLATTSANRLSEMSMGQLDILQSIHKKGLEDIGVARFNVMRHQERMRIEEEVKQQNYNN